MENGSRIPDYAKELELFSSQLENDDTLQLPQFCASRGIHHQELLDYIAQHGIDVRSLQSGSGRKTSSQPDPDPRSGSLSGVTIKLPSHTEVTIGTISASQLSYILKKL